MASNEGPRLLAEGPSYRGQRMLEAGAWYSSSATAVSVASRFSDFRAAAEAFRAKHPYCLSLLGLFLQLACIFVTARVNKNAPAVEALMRQKRRCTPNKIPLHNEHPLGQIRL